MEILTNTVLIIYIIVCLVLIVLALMQAKEGDGASETIVGGSSSSFYEKNKGKTKEGKLKKATIACAIVFVVLTLVLGILYMM